MLTSVSVPKFLTIIRRVFIGLSRHAGEDPRECEGLEISKVGKLL